MTADPWQKPERLALAALAREFTVREIVPHLAGWERAGELPRSLHRSAARAAFPEDCGGQGGEAIDGLVVAEAMISAGGSSGLVAALFTHGIAVPHILAAGDRSQIDRFVRPSGPVTSLSSTDPRCSSRPAAGPISSPRRCAPAVPGTAA